MVRYHENMNPWYYSVYEQDKNLTSRVAAELRRAAYLKDMEGVLSEAELEVKQTLKDLSKFRKQEQLAQAKRIAKQEAAIKAQAEYEAKREARFAEASAKVEAEFAEAEAEREAEAKAEASCLIHPMVTYLPGIDPTPEAAPERAKLRAEQKAKSKAEHEARCREEFIIKVLLEDRDYDIRLAGGLEIAGSHCCEVILADNSSEVGAIITVKAKDLGCTDSMSLTLTSSDREYQPEVEGPTFYKRLNLKKVRANDTLEILVRFPKEVTNDFKEGLVSSLDLHLTDLVESNFDYQGVCPETGNILLEFLGYRDCVKVS